MAPNVYPYNCTLLSYVLPQLNVIRKGSKKLLTIKNSKRFSLTPSTLHACSAHIIAQIGSWRSSI